MPYVKVSDRYQLEMTSLDLMVDKDSICRIIDAFVDSLDLTKLGFKHTSPSFEGRPSYPPQALLKLYIYGHRNGIRSSRKLQKECHVNIEVKWLTWSLEPDFRTISDFRKDHHAILKKVLYEFNQRFSDLMTGFNSVDGTKIIASNGRDRNFTASKLDDRIDWLSKHIEEYLRQMDQQDSGEEIPGALTAEELDAKIKEARERLEKYQNYRADMEKENLSQLSLTDKDARLMKNRNGFTVSHNVQSVVDSETHMIVDFSVTSSPTDYNQLEPTLHEMKANRPGQILEATADKGYQSTEDIARCLESGIIPHVILPDGKDTYEIDIPYEEKQETDPASTEAADLKACLRAGILPDAYKDVIQEISVVEKEVPIADDIGTLPSSPFKDEEEMKGKAAEGFFVRDPERNIVYCPAGNILRQNYVTKKDRIRYINKSACRSCPYRNQCYRGKKGFKEVEFNKDEYVKANGIWQKSNNQKPVFHKNKKKKELRKVVTIIFRPDKQKMDQRKCLSEHPFGTIKRSMDSSYFLLRGNQKVTGEFALFSLAYNLQRAVNLLGFDEVMRRMRVNTSFFSVLFKNLAMWMRNRAVLIVTMA